jgi:hypothetical protein
MNDSVKLAKMWVEFETLKQKLDNELIPVAGYLHIEDLELINAMTELSAKINNYFEANRLKIESNKYLTQKA